MQGTSGDEDAAAGSSRLLQCAAVNSFIIIVSSAHYYIILLEVISRYCHITTITSSFHHHHHFSWCPVNFGVQVVSMAADNVIKVWDLRNHRCIQTIADVDWPSQEDAHPSAMMYDPARCVDLLPSHTYTQDSACTSILCMAVWNLSHSPYTWARQACSAHMIGSYLFLQSREKSSLQKGCMQSAWSSC